MQLNYNFLLLLLFTLSSTLFKIEHQTYKKLKYVILVNITLKKALNLKFQNLPNKYSSSTKIEAEEILKRK